MESSSSLQTPPDEPDSGIGPDRKQNDLNGNGKNSLLQTMRLWLSESFSSKAEEDDNSLQTAIDEIIEENGEKQISLTHETRGMLQNIVSFGELKIHDVMIPRVNIVAIDDSSSIQDVQAIIKEHEHTRMPVYRGNIDDVIGFLHIKDLVNFLGSEKEFSISKILRKILVVPPSMLVIDLLVKMRLSRVHMALVVDEYGGTDGLVTMEDLVEEIVGDIHDEHDEEEEVKIRKIKAGEYEVDAQMEVDELEEVLNTKLRGIDEHDDYDTLGGLIFTIAGKVPNKGDIIDHPSSEYKFIISEADNRRIKKVKVMEMQD